MPQFLFRKVSQRHYRIALDQDGRTREVGAIKRIADSGRWIVLNNREHTSRFIYPGLASAQAAVSRAEPDLMQKLGVDV